MWIDVLILTYGAFCFLYLSYHCIQGIRGVKKVNDWRQKNFEREQALYTEQHAKENEE